MFCASRLIALAALATAVAGSAVPRAVKAPAYQGVPDSDSGPLDIAGTETDQGTIVDTALVVDQKSSPPVDAPPDLPVTDTVVTAVDGTLTNETVPVTRRSLTRRSVSKRAIDDYEVVFDGTGTRETDRDGSIQGTAYLTYTVVSNATYNVEACAQKCDEISQCVFFNIYYEYNNPGCDWEFGSNLKCAFYGDVHTAAEKTNTGGQQLEPLPHGLTYIQQSSGYAKKTLTEPEAPEGYELVGEWDGANNAPGYMGFAFLDKYDVDACAALCNTRGVDGNGGACQYFNIWRAVVRGDPTTYTCSFYYLVADASTAVNYGQGDLKVTYSRGYSRTSAVLDGEFESYACANNGIFCFTDKTSTWIATTPSGGFWDASVFHYAPYAHFGNGVALLGSAYGADALPGTLTPAKPLKTVAGKKYLIQFFHSSFYSGEILQASAFVDVYWNGVKVAGITPGYSQWKYYEFSVTAVGNDKLEFKGGKAPAYSFLDGVYVFQI